MSVEDEEESGEDEDEDMESAKQEGIELLAEANGKLPYLGWDLDVLPVSLQSAQAWIVPAEDKEGYYCSLCKKIGMQTSGSSV